MAPRLRMAFLGGFRVALDEAPLSGFVSNKARALLCYLAVTRQPHSRQQLATLLWGDAPEAQALASLRQALKNLRDLAGPFLIVDQQSVALSRAGDYWLDVERFEALLRPESDLASPEARRAALELYQGEFLAGFTVRDALEFEEWALLQRARLHEGAVGLLQRLAEDHLRAGSYAEGIVCAGRLLELEPWREEAYRLLMLLLARGGQRSAALAQYEICRRVLRDELGVEPLEETTRLYERLRQAQPARSPSLPVPTTPLVGRREELARIAAALAEPGCRLVTVSGPGGIGKTRLALQLAEQQRTVFLHGSCFVPLSSVDGLPGLLSALAFAVGYTFAGAEPAERQLLGYLREQELLLVLDTFEHLIPQAGGFLAQLLRHAPDLRLLVTSRERLQLQGEWVLELHGLPVPGPGVAASLADAGAVELFVGAARRASQSFALESEAPAVAQICRQVEGMPLALELAASWVRMLSCREIAQEISAGLDFLASSWRGVPEQQRSVRAAFDHSWRLLAPDERAALRRLAVFPGSFARDAAAHVAGASLALLSSLLDKSLVRRSAPDRYDLHGLIRQYAAAQLAESGEDEAVRARHGGHYLGLLARRAESLRGAGQRQALAEIGAEIESARQAWDWALEQSQLDLLAPALDALCDFYDTSGWFQEAEERCAAVAALLERRRAAQPAAPGERLLLGRALARQAWFRARRGGYYESLPLLRESLPHLSAQQPDSPEARRERGFAHSCLGYAELRIGDYEASRRESQLALELYQSIPYPHGIAHAANNLGIIADVRGDYETAARHYRECLAINQQTGNQRGIARALMNLGDTRRLQGDYAAARALQQQCYEVASAVGDRMLAAHALLSLGIVTADGGDHDEGERILREAMDGLRAIGYRMGLLLALNQLGWIAQQQGRMQEAKAQHYEALRVSLDMQASAEILASFSGLATCMLSEGRHEQALALAMVVDAHPACEEVTRAAVAELAEELSLLLERPEVRAACERALALPLHELAAEVLGARSQEPGARSSF